MLVLACDRSGNAARASFWTSEAVRSGPPNLWTGTRGFRPGAERMSQVDHSGKSVGLRGARAVLAKHKPGQAKAYPTTRDLILHRFLN